MSGRLLRRTFTVLFVVTVTLTVLALAGLALMLRSPYLAHNGSLGLDALIAFGMFGALSAAIVSGMARSSSC